MKRLLAGLLNSLRVGSICLARDAGLCLLQSLFLRLLVPDASGSMVLGILPSWLVVEDPITKA